MVVGPTRAMTVVFMDSSFRRKWASFKAVYFSRALVMMDSSNDLPEFINWAPFNRLTSLFNSYRNTIETILVRLQLGTYGRLWMGWIWFTFNSWACAFIMSMMLLICSSTCGICGLPTNSPPPNDFVFRGKLDFGLSLFPLRRSMRFPSMSNPWSRPIGTVPPKPVSSKRNAETSDLWITRQKLHVHFSRIWI